MAALLAAAPAPPPAADRVPIWMHLAALGAITLATLYISQGLWGWTYDDAYIIYRYARNFAAGLGMVYNPGQPYLGTSSVGYTLLLAALSWVVPGGDFLTLGSVVSTAGFWATGALLWVLGVRARAPLAGILAALITVTNPVLVETWGGEMELLLPLVLGAILSYTAGAGIPTGILLALAVLTRQDSLVLVALLGAHYLWRRRQLPRAGGLAFVLVLAPWLLYSWWFFGSPLPGTLEAKIAQGKAGWPFFLSGAIQWMSDRLGGGLVRPLVLGLAGGGGAALAWAAWRRRPVGAWWLVLGWGALFAAGYTALRVAFYGWYAVPLAVSSGILIAWGAAELVALAERGGRALGTRRRPSARPAPTLVQQGLAAGLGLLVLAAILPPVATHVQAFDDNFIRRHRFSDLYRRVGTWLAAHGGPATSVAYLEVGEMGYYSQAQVVDLLGLVTPGAAAHVPFADYDWPIQQYLPEYYLANTRFDKLLAYQWTQSWFQDAYAPVARFDDTWQFVPGNYHLVVYQRKPGVVLPLPLQPVAIQRTTQQPAWLVPGRPAAEWPGQSFTAPAANLGAVAVLVGKPYDMPVGSLVFHLRRQPTDAQDLRRVEVPLPRITNNTWHTFRFDPIPDSASRQYFFNFEFTGLPADAKPMSFWCATDDLYPGGSRYLGPLPQPGDLTFRLLVPETSRP